MATLFCTVGTRFPEVQENSFILKILQIGTWRIDPFKLNVVILFTYMNCFFNGGDREKRVLHKISYSRNKSNNTDNNDQYKKNNVFFISLFYSRSKIS